MATKQFEKIADKLAKKTIQQERGRCIDELGNKIPDILTEETCVDGTWVTGFTNIDHHQKTIKDGSIQSGRSEDDVTVLYGSDLIANSEDIDNITGGTLTEDDLNVSSLSDLEISNMISNPENVSQFVDFDPSQLIVNPDLADEVLNRDITELVPTQGSRQQDILNFFDEFDGLVGDPPNFTEPDEIGNVEYIDDGTWSDISNAPGNSEASITRIDEEASGINNTKTLETLRNTLNDYLKDVDSVTTDIIDDSRPEYEESSDGFLKVRGLNQSILIKQEEGQELSISKLTETYPASGIYEPKYLVDGFTTTMWIRFKDMVNGGTLFNYGNPIREMDPHGIRLETFIIEKNDPNIPVPSSFQFEDGTIPFNDYDYERFVRLIVRKDDTNVYDSHVGLPNNVRTSGIAEGSTLFNCTRIPIDLNEWYFIVATYNPVIIEDIAGDGSSYLTNPDYWRWNYRDAIYDTDTGYGAKCKVEIISKSDLLRARGYKT